MRILILGSGGREHTFAWKIKKSSSCSALFVAPGNAGTAEIGTNLEADVNNFPAIKKIVKENAIDLVLVGPEAPLVNGIVDYFEQDPELKQVVIIGPNKVSAQLEGSKAFAKAFMVKNDIPTASYETFTKETLSKGKAYLAEHALPIVLKADGLAAGKGVLICEDYATADEEFDKMLNGKFGDASQKVVVEQFLSGIEFSVFVITDGKNYQILPVAKDYKRIGEGDTGPNTGGMGSISPVRFVDHELMTKVEKRIIQPTIAGLNKEGYAYKGFIFFGLINVKGDPYVIEYNCRMGDPETQVVLPRLQNDLVELLVATDQGGLDRVKIEVSDEAASTVILVSGGYPGPYEKGKAIYGIEAISDSLLFHAGTRISNGEIVTNGGRVIAVTSRARNYEDALNVSYKNAELIRFDGKYFRTDIGFDL